MNKFWYSLLCLLMLQQANAQDNSFNWLKKLESFKIQPVIGLQFWTSYTTGTEVYDGNTGNYVPVDDRLNVQLRRTRLGLKGEIYTNFKYNFTTSLDFVGKDVLSGPQGPGNNGANPRFRLWHAYVQWRIVPKKEHLHLTIGHFSPQFSGSSINGAFGGSSMEKSWTQNYIRRHIVGVGPGRAPGINLGGLFLKEEGKVAFSYDVGVYTPTFQSLGGNSSGVKSSPLFIGRGVIHLGDPEFKTYKMGRRSNYWGERRGLSIAVQGAIQGETDLFKQNYAFGLDWLFNWDHFNLDGEWLILGREGDRFQPDGSIINLTSTSNAGFLRASYLVRLKSGRVIEPAFMVTQFNGGMDAADQSEAIALSAFAGQNHVYDIGVNYHFNPKLKLSLHYIIETGDLGDAAPGTTFNNFFTQGGVGAFQRGDWLGLGLVVVF